MRRTSEKPLEWRPRRAKPRTTSPAARSAAREKRVALDRADREAGEVVVASPDRDPASPPSRRRPARRPACRQPSAMPSMTSPAVVRRRAPRWRNSRGRRAARRPARRGRSRTWRRDRCRSCRDARSRWRSSAWCRRRRSSVTSTGSRKPAAFRSNSAPNPPSPPITPGRGRGRRRRLDPLHQCVAGIDIDAGVAIGQGLRRARSLAA